MQLSSVSSGIRRNINGEWEDIDSGKILREGDLIDAQNNNSPVTLDIHLDPVTWAYFFTWKNERIYLRDGRGYTCPVPTSTDPGLPDRLDAERQRMAGMPISDELKKTLLEHFKWIASHEQLGQPANMKFKDLSKLNLSGVNLSKVNLDHANFTKAVLDGVEMVRSSPWEAIFKNASIRGSNLSLITGVDANFENADISGTDFYHANLGEAIFTGAKGAGANFEGANLEKASFKNADLCGANFFKAKLENADLTGARLLRADLTDANLKGAIISDEQLAKVKSLSGVAMLDRTRHK